MSKDGPYRVPADVPIVRRTVEEDADGRKRWGQSSAIRAEVGQDGQVALCRCGHSDNKPFCDGTHRKIGFDGTEAAPTKEYDELARERRGNDVVMGDAKPLCAHTGMCAKADDDVWQMLGRDLDADERAELEEMVELCPSGRLAHRREQEQAWDEPTLPEQVVLLADAQIMVTGQMRVERSDGKPMEPRNRVSLCRCGASQSKPLCDGSHAEVGFTDPEAAEKAGQAE